MRPRVVPATHPAADLEEALIGASDRRAGTARRLYHAFWSLRREKPDLAQEKRWRAMRAFDKSSGIDEALAIVRRWVREHPGLSDADRELES